jgi:protocatechuate 3,4-dioxygenase beta subunit
LQTVTNEHGRYRFDAVEPGTYVVSAYYNISGRGQIEVRRAGIEVERAQGVIVPIWLELTGQ